MSETGTEVGYTKTQRCLKISSKIRFDPLGVAVSWGPGTVLNDVRTTVGNGECQPKYQERAQCFVEADIHILLYIINILTRRFLRLRGLLVSGKVLPLPFGCLLFLLLPASICQLRTVKA